MDMIHDVFAFRDLKAGVTHMSIENDWLIVRRANKSERYRTKEISSITVVVKRESGLVIVFIGAILIGGSLVKYISESFTLYGLLIVAAGLIMPSLLAKTSLEVRFYRGEPLVFCSDKNQLEDVERWLDKQLSS